MIPIFKIGDREIGTQKPMYIIAEISCNHEGNLAEARRIVEAAARSGADAVKLQTYTADTISVKKPIVAEGTMWSKMNLHSLYDKAHTPWEWHSELKKVAADNGVHLFSSPFDERALDFLIDQQVPVLKVASFEVVDIHLLEKMAQTGLPIIMSNGMTDFLEMQEAYQTLTAGRSGKVALLHCNSGYPASFDECNLLTIPWLRELFQCAVGLSDHTIFEDDKNFANPLPHIAPLEARKLGASILEVHLTMDREEGRRLHSQNIGGFDWAFSRTPAEFKMMTETIRAFEKNGASHYATASEKSAAARAQGSVCFEPTEKEKTSKNLRPTLWVVEDIRAGELLRFKGGKPGNFDSLRPGGGLHIRFAKSLDGKRASQDIKAGTPLTWAMVKSPG